MHNAVLLANENEKLYIENQRQKRKRKQKRSYLRRGGVLSGAEGQSLIENPQNSRTEVVEDKTSGVRERAPRKCSLYSSLEYNARICLER